MARYRLLFLALLPALLLAFPVGAEGLPSRPLTADLDGDGRLERISWFRFAETEEDGEFFQVQVHDAGGRLLWASAKVLDSMDPLVFGNWHFGFSLPELVADIDGDGRMELVAPAPQSDVSPTYFRVFRWRDGRFQPADSGMLLESPPGSGLFSWTRGDQWQGTWISSFQAIQPDGTFQVEVFDYRGGANPRQGIALVTQARDGFQVRNWPRPLAQNALPAPEPTEMPRADGQVVYRARLGPQDHVNSSGTPLKTVGQILRQDRANLERGLADAGDEPDPLFASRAGRERMDQLRPVPVGSASNAWTNAIIHGQPLIEVEVTASELRVRIIEP
jgi:hypothetical protein